MVFSNVTYMFNMSIVYGGEHRSSGRSFLSRM